jgi:UDP-N-acetylmuramate--alanine ligase
MHVYFSGIGGVGIGPLSMIAKDLGYEVTGSNNEENQFTDIAKRNGINVVIGQDTDSISKIHQDTPIDWFVYTSSLPDDHPELVFAKANNIKTSKRDQFINHFLSEKNLKMLAIAGTHGKTNTTGLLVWLFKQFDIPASYSIGSNISFGPAAAYQPNSKFFIYEADEFDRNFLHFKPYASVITSADYDHPDTYPTIEDYKKAFQKFATQSEQVTTWQSIADYLGLSTENSTLMPDDTNVGATGISLIGEYTRRNAYLALVLFENLFPSKTRQQVIAAINHYPGTERRMEKIADNLYSDYAHHPVEIAATISAAAELGKNVVVVYQPHQNVRQHQVSKMYQNCFNGAHKIYWLPTYLSRESHDLPVLTPEELINNLSDPNLAEPKQMNDELVAAVKSHVKNDDLVLLLNAGNLDAWARQNLID